jgi:tetratricopeptide (TPR) repeat protein
MRLPVVIVFSTKSITFMYTLTVLRIMPASFTKMQPPRILLFLCAAFFLIQAFPQNSKIDSVTALLPKLPNDSTKENTLVFLANEYRKLGDSLTLRYAQEAYNLAATLRFYKGQAGAATQLGRYMRQLTRREEALKYFQESIELSEKLGRLSGIAAGNLNMGTIYYELANYELAREYFEKARVAYEKDNDRAGVALASGNIGITFEGEGNYIRALDAYFHALKMNEEINNKQGMSYNYGAIAINYSKQGDHQKSIEFHQKVLDIVGESDRYFVAVTQVNMGTAYTKMKEYAKALEVLNKALLSFQQMRSVGVQAHALASIGRVYLNQGDLTAAAGYFRRALRVRSKGDESGNSSDLAHLSETYVKMGKADSALYFAKQALTFVDRLNDMETISHINKAAFEAYKLKGDPGAALRYYERYVLNKDSIFNKEKNAKFKELQIKYETDKKEQQITILNNENALQESKFNNRVLMLSLVVAVTLAIIAFLFITIKANRRRQ